MGKVTDGGRATKPAEEQRDEGSNEVDGASSSYASNVIRDLNDDGLLQSSLVQLMIGATLGMLVALALRHQIWGVVDHLSTISTYVGSLSAGGGPEGLAAPATVFDSYTTSSDSDPTFYPAAPESAVFGRHAHFLQSSLEYRLGEVVSLANGTLQRTVVHLGTAQSRAALFADTLQPSVFVISSDTERL